MHQQSGHGKDMIKLWTDSKNNKQPWLFFLSFFPLSFSFFNFYSAWVLVFLFFFFLKQHRYFGKKVDAVDKLLLSIKVPTWVTRRPRTIAHHLSYWKASEVRSWILYYSLPLLAGVLPQVYLDHWALLVCGFWLVLQGSISKDDLTLTRWLFQNYVHNLGLLYGAHHCTMNAHNLLHLADTVEKVGPLWANSCFSFEAENAMLNQEILGTNNVVKMVGSFLFFLLCAIFFEKK